MSLCFLAARFHSYPASCSLRRTVRELAGLPDVSAQCVENSGDKTVRFYRLRRTSLRSSLAVEIFGRQLLWLFSNCSVALKCRITSETVETDREIRSAICLSDIPSLCRVVATIRSVIETSDFFVIASRF